MEKDKDIEEKNRYYQRITYLCKKSHSIKLFWIMQLTSVMTKFCQCWTPPQSTQFPPYLT